MLMNMFRLRQEMSLMRFERLGFDGTAIDLWSQVNSLLFFIRLQIKEDAP